MTVVVEESFPNFSMAAFFLFILLWARRGRGPGEIPIWRVTVCAALWALGSSGSFGFQNRHHLVLSSRSVCWFSLTLSLPHVLAPHISQVIFIVTLQILASLFVL